MVSHSNGVSQRHLFGSPADKSRLARYERLHNGCRVQSVDYAYGKTAGAADYRLCVSETSVIYGEGALSSETVVAYAYSADKRANVVPKSVGYTDEPARSTHETFAYGVCSQLTERRAKTGEDRYVSEQYTLSSLVPSFKRVYEINGGLATLREKTEYLYGNTPHDLYCVTEERRYFGDELETSDTYAATRFEYDPACRLHKPSVTRLVGIYDAGGDRLPDITSTAEYDIYGNPLRTVDGCGVETLCVYDALGRLTRRLHPAVQNTRSSVELIYDDLSNSITTTDENGEYTRVEYTPAGYPARAYLANGKQPDERDILTAEYLYDPQGRCREERVYDGQGNILNRTLCEYDLYGNLQTKQIPECGYYELHEYAKLTELPYDGSRKGSMHRVTVLGDSSAPSVVTESYTDIAGNEEAVYLDGALRQRYAHDISGGRLSATDALGNTETYALDYAGRTLSVSKLHNGETVTAYTVYDALGSKTAVTDFMGNTAYFHYDAAGRCVRTVMPFDGTEYAEARTGYDACGRVVCRMDKTALNEWKTERFVYDKRGRLTDRCVYLDSALNNWIQTHTEYDPAGNKLSISTCETGWGKGSHYLFGGSIAARESPLQSRDAPQRSQYD